MDDSKEEVSELNVKRARDSLENAKDRVKLVRVKQDEDRQRKFEEIRQQALAAQRYREQREEERRKRIEEHRIKGGDRRIQVEERKRLIYEAEQERREAILRKNQERDARIEAKRRNERSNIAFAFGSSTPRMLEPADTGGSSFWGNRRATSTSNVMMFPMASTLTRRSSERDLDGSKKRATSAGGLDRKSVEGDDNDGIIGSTGTFYHRVNRRRTDLTPTIPSQRDRDTPPTPSRMSMSMTSSMLKSFTRSPGVRSGEVTPNSPSRPHSSMSQQSVSSVGSCNVNLRPRTTTPRRPRPASIAGTGVSVAVRNNAVGESPPSKDSKPPLPKNPITPKKASTPRALTDPMKKFGEKLSRSAKPSPRATPRATPLQSPSIEQCPNIHVEAIDKKSIRNSKSFEKKDDKKVNQSPESVEKSQDNTQTEAAKSEVKTQPAPTVESNDAEIQHVTEETNQEPLITLSAQNVTNEAQNGDVTKAEEKLIEQNIEDACDMTASMIQKIRITTEEEAKAALAERRRLAREQAEREAELERQREEENARLEMERLHAEEQRQRQLEEETLRLAEEAREAEERRLQLAIEEAARREEEDRKRRDEEARQKLEKEEAERKAKEEVEKQRIEMAERLKKEEEERNARRKRVEAIMSRTRSKNQPNTPSKGDGDDDKSKDDSQSENKSPPNEKIQDVMTASLISEATQQFINAEQAHRMEVTDPLDVLRNGMHTNGINEVKTILDNKDSNEAELNGHHTNHGNGIDSQAIALDNAAVKQNNVTNNLLDLSEFDTLSGGGPILQRMPNLANEDSLNSNLNITGKSFTVAANPCGPTAVNVNVEPFQDVFTNNLLQDNQVPDLQS